MFYYYSHITSLSSAFGMCLREKWSGVGFYPIFRFLHGRLHLLICLFPILSRGILNRAICIHLQQNGFRVRDVYTCGHIGAASFLQHVLLAVTFSFSYMTSNTCRSLWKFCEISRETQHSHCSHWLPAMWNQSRNTRFSLVTLIMSNVKSVEGHNTFIVHTDYEQNEISGRAQHFHYNKNKAPHMWQAPIYFFANFQKMARIESVSECEAIPSVIITWFFSVPGNREDMSYDCKLKTI